MVSATTFIVCMFVGYGLGLVSGIICGRSGRRS
jgi:hypothetical protein